MDSIPSFIATIFKVPNMSASEFVDLITKISAIAALAIISIPKLTELVLGRFISSSLERQKKELQIELESHKLEFNKALETHKAELQRLLKNDERVQNEIRESTRDYAQQLSLNLNSLLNDIRQTSTRIHTSAPQAYKEVSELLERLYGTNIKKLPECFKKLRDTDEFCEEPGALLNPDFVESLRYRLSQLATAVENEILLLKGGSNAIKIQQTT